MNININKILTVTHYKAVIISTIITALLTPLFWILSDANINWILFANIISFTGTLILIYPFINYVYPYMLTKVTTFLLTSLLTIVSIWINMTAIAFALPHYYIYEATLNATIEKVLAIGTGYIVAINSITLPILYQDKKIQSFF